MGYEIGYLVAKHGLDQIVGIDLSIFETENIQNLSLLMLLAIGLVDLVAGVMLWRR